MNESNFMPKNNPQIYKPEEEPIAKAEKAAKISKNFIEKMTPGAAATHFGIELSGMLAFQAISDEDIRKAVEEFNGLAKQRKEVEENMTPVEKIRMLHGQITENLKRLDTVPKIQSTFAEIKMAIQLIDKLPAKDQEILRKQKEFLVDMADWLTGVYKQYLSKNREQ